MITEIKKTKNEEYRLYIWREREEIGKGLEIRVTTKSGEYKPIKILKNKIEGSKFYPTIKMIHNSSEYNVEWRDGLIQEWQKGLPNFVAEKPGTPEFLKYDPNKTKNIKEKKYKHPAVWVRYLSADAKYMKQKIDEGDKNAKEDDFSIFQPYPKELFELYARDKVRYYRDYPDHEPTPDEDPGKISSMLTKGIVWGVIRKYKAKLENPASPTLEHDAKVLRMNIGKLRTNEDLAINALQKYDAPSKLLAQERAEEIEFGPDPYIETQSKETLNNKLFMDLEPDKQRAIMKAVGLSDKDIRQRMAAITDKSDAGSKVEPKFKKDENGFYPFEEILKAGKEDKDSKK
jgi:hypothetical protein